MTPKLKASELINKFSLINGNISPKQCAIICVDEIIKAIGAFGYSGAMYDDFETGKIQLTTDTDPIEYWQHVKTEIEKS